MLSPVAASPPHLRIGVSAHGTRGRASGLGHYVRNLLMAWLNNGERLELHVFCAHEDADDFRVAVDPRLIIHRAGAWRSSPGRDILWHQVVLPWKAKRLGLDVLFIAVDRRIVAFSPVPMVTTVHDLAAWALPGKYASSQQCYSKHIVPWLLRHAGRLITVSEHTRQDLARWAKIDASRATVIHHGVDQARFHTHHPERQRRTLARHGIDKPYLLYPARLEHPGKNHVGVIAALDHLRRQGLPLPHVVFAGAPWHQAQRIHEALQSSGLQASFTITGFIPDEELVDLYHAATAMLYPSLYEGFGMPLVEAMAAGLPIICSHAACLPEIVGDAALLVDPHQPQTMADAICRLLSDVELQETLRARGIERAKRFTWERAAQETLNTLRGAIVARVHNPDLAA